jgi:xylulokinase
MIAGIDLGTQGIKVLVVDDAFQARGKSFAPYPTACPRPGCAEQDPAQWETALAAAVRGALDQARVGPDAVKAVGITGQLDGCIAVDRAGRPLAPCLIWMDRRARVDIPPAALERVKQGGVNPDPGHMAAKIRWLADTVPAAAEASCFHQPVSWLVRRLTGADVYDHGLASTTMLYSLGSRGYDDELLGAFGISRERLPRIAAAESLAGVVTREGAAASGLEEGTAVAVGTGDDFASPLGAGLVAPGRAACISGTAEVVGALSPQPVIDPEGLVETHPYPGGSYLVENPGWLSGGAACWLSEVLGLGGPVELTRRAAEAPPGAGGVLFLPALSGAMSPAWIPSARGCFYGLAPAHGPAHLARAVLEGCAFAMRDVLERLSELSVPAAEVVLAGGGANSRLWASIRADVSGRVVRRLLDADTAPRGAAMLAAVAAGRVPDLRACAAGIAAPVEEIVPDPAAGPVYTRAYRGYRRLFESLRPMFEDLEDP